MQAVEVVRLGQGLRQGEQDPQAELDAARVALDQTALVAPGDGVILRRTGEVGALVTFTLLAPVVSMADLTGIELRAEIDEADLAAIAVGQAAYATADAFGDRRSRS